MKEIAAAGLGIAVSASALTIQAQDRSQSRSMVISRSGIVASESVIASQVGASILERGGNAIDAAVAQCVAEIMPEGMEGGALSFSAGRLKEASEALGKLA